jgi:pimeloyl-ACP methyl ester carboxylesterase
MLPPSSIPASGSALHGKTRLVYLPGIDGTGRLLHRQPRLFEEYDVSCVSYPQYGPNTYDELVSLGEAKLPAEGGVVLAESFGVAVALMLALKRPELVRHLVLVNGFAYYPRRPLIHLLASLGSYLPKRPSSSWTRSMRGILFFPPNTSKAEQDAWWDLTADVPMWAYGMRVALITTMDVRPRLRDVSCPTTVFVAPNDRIVPPPAGRLMAKRLPNVRLIEKPLGHAAMIHPDVDVARWLSDTGANSFHATMHRETKRERIATV